MSMKTSLMKLALVLAIVFPMKSFGATVALEIKNMTAMQTFSPPAIVIHKPSFKLFELGQPAREAVWRIAEDGDVAAAKILKPSEGVRRVVIGQPIRPGETKTFMVQVPRGYQISLASMLATTNDGFFGFSNLNRPMVGEEAVILAEGLDAGTESNNESCQYVPGPPCSAHGVRMEAGAEGQISIHKGIMGNVDVPAAYGWSNPVAKIVIYRD